MLNEVESPNIDRAGSCDAGEKQGEQTSASS